MSKNAGWVYKTIVKLVVKKKKKAEFVIESGPGIFKLNINLGIFLRKTGGLVSTQVQKLSERLSPAFSKRKPGQLVGKWFTSPSTPFLCLLRVSPSRLWEELREKTLPGFSLSEEGGQVSEACC